MNKVKICVSAAKLIVTACLLFSVLVFSCSKKNDTPANLTPAISSLSPVQGQPGAVVTITGSNYSTDKAKNTVKFGTALATVSTASATELKVLVPGTLASGALKVTVTTNENISAEKDFTVLAPDADMPQITSIDPSSAKIGSTLTLKGNNFGVSNIITFTSVTTSTLTSSVTVAGGSPLQVVVPASLTAGDYNITLNNGNKTSAGALFTVLYTPSTITGFSPDSVSKGQTLTITGTNFLNNIDSLTINGVKQTITIVNATTITLNILPKTFSGKIAVYKSGTAMVYDAKNVGYKETYTASKFSSYGLANDIAIDKSGNIFLATNSAIIKLNAQGILIDTLVKQDSATFVGILLRTNGDMLVSAYTNTHVTILKITGKNKMDVICIYNGNSDIYLTENSNQEVYFIFCSSKDNSVYKLNNGVPSVFVSSAITSGSKISAIASDKQGNLYITDWYNHKLIKIGTTGTLTEMGNNSNIFGFGEIGVNPKNNVMYISQEVNNYTIVRFVDNTHFYTLPTQNLAFQSLSIAFTPEGDIISCETYKNYLMKIIVD